MGETERAFFTYCRLLVTLHVHIVYGLGESAAADLLREEMDRHGDVMTEKQRALTTQISALLAQGYGEPESANIERVEG